MADAEELRQRLADLRQRKQELDADLAEVDEQLEQHFQEQHAPGKRKRGHLWPLPGVAALAGGVSQHPGISAAGSLAVIGGIAASLLIPGADGPDSPQAGSPNDEPALTRPADQTEPDTQPSPGAQPEPTAEPAQANEPPTIEPEINGNIRVAANPAPSDPGGQSGTQGDSTAPPPEGRNAEPEPGQQPEPSPEPEPDSPPTGDEPAPPEEGRDDSCSLGVQADLGVARAEVCAVPPASVEAEVLP